MVLWYFTQLMVLYYPLDDYFIQGPASERRGTMWRSSTRWVRWTTESFSKDVTTPVLLFLECSAGFTCQSFKRWKFLSVQEISQWWFFSCFRVSTSCRSTNHLCIHGVGNPTTRFQRWFGFQWIGDGSLLSSPYYIYVYIYTYVIRSLCPRSSLYPHSIPIHTHNIPLVSVYIYIFLFPIVYHVTLMIQSNHIGIVGYITFIYHQKHRYS